ncbi:MAG TPA: hypothetical protein GX513_03875 [Firmicutes bacterium]|nr:hypothetical protein [Bacillota bacterium]
MIVLSHSDAGLRFQASVHVECHSPILVQGSGPGKGTADQIFFQRKGLAAIPGSSLRGAWRHALERLLRQLGEPVCNPPHPDSMCPHEDIGLPRGEFCMACSVFGSPWIASRLVITDLYALQEEPKSEEWLRYGVGVNRVTGTVSPGKLFVVQVPYARRFEGSIRGELTMPQLGLLLAAVRLVTHLGSGRARGLGRVSLTVTHLRDGKGSPLQWSQEHFIAEALKGVGV